MLATVKSYIAELPDIPFDEFYQRYICSVQDMNVQAELKGVQTDEIISLNRLLMKLKYK